MVPTALMRINQGESVACTLISEQISGTGRYKFLAKKKANGIYEWIHFTERDNGREDNVCHGEASGKEELNVVIEIMNRNLTRIFGACAEMKNYSGEGLLG